MIFAPCCNLAKPDAALWDRDCHLTNLPGGGGTRGSETIFSNVSFITIICATLFAKKKQHLLLLLQHQHSSLFLSSVLFMTQFYSFCVCNNPTKNSRPPLERREVHIYVFGPTDVEISPRLVTTPQARCWLRPQDHHVFEFFGFSSRVIIGCSDDCDTSDSLALQWKGTSLYALRSQEASLQETPPFPPCRYTDNM